MLRDPTPDESASVIAWFEGLEEGLWNRMRGLVFLAVNESDGKRVATLASSALRGLPEALRAGEPTTGGLAIGRLEEDGFHLGLQGAVLTALKTRAGSVKVTEHAAQLFLYGRVMLEESVLWHDPLLRVGASCIVTDHRNEPLGVGRVVGNFKGRGEAVSAVHDLGTYLRDQDE